MILRFEMVLVHSWEFVSVLRATMCLARLPPYPQHDFNTVYPLSPLEDRLTPILPINNTSWRFCPLTNLPRLTRFNTPVINRTNHPNLRQTIIRQRSRVSVVLIDSEDDSLNGNEVLDVNVSLELLAAVSAGPVEFAKFVGIEPIDVEPSFA